MIYDEIYRITPMTLALESAFREKYRVHVSASEDVESGRFRVVRADATPFSPEQSGFIEGFAEGFRKGSKA